ncbi:MAG: hypothetical protein IJ411_02095 [Oscillospiraceae bacterium]|nr:hypothetical protein [Oscillospiraceae bacterium]
MIEKSKIIECAEELLKNTQFNLNLRKALERFIRDAKGVAAPNADSWLVDELRIVISKICEDGYDITGFELRDIPHSDPSPQIRRLAYPPQKLFRLPVGARNVPAPNTR